MLSRNALRFRNKDPPHPERNVGTDWNVIVYGQIHVSEAQRRTELGLPSQATAQERNEMGGNYPLLPVWAGHLWQLVRIGLEAFEIGWSAGADNSHIQVKLLRHVSTANSGNTSQTIKKLLMLPYATTSHLPPEAPVV